MTTYKYYSYSSSTYTDISNEIKNNPTIDRVNVNADMTPIIQSIKLETVTDLTSTTLADDKVVIVTVNTGTEKVINIYYVKSSYRDKKTRLYYYDCEQILGKLKDVTTSTLADTDFDETTYKSALNESSIYSGTTTIDWYDVKLRGVFEQIFEDSDIMGNITFTVDISGLDTNMTTLINNYCVSSLCLKYLGTDFSDEEITAGTEDLTKIWDMLKELFKVLGIKYDFYYTKGSTITIYLYSQASIPSSQSLVETDMFSFKENIKLTSEQKTFNLKQNILNIEDTANENNYHRYFSPLMYGIPNFLIFGAELTDQNVYVGSYSNMNIPDINTMFNKIKCIDAFEGSYDNLEDFIYEDISTLTIFNNNITGSRHTRSNVVSGTAISYFEKEKDSFVATLTINSHGFTSSDNIVIYDFIFSEFNGQYLYEATAPTSSLKYTIIDSSTIKIYGYGIGVWYQRGGSIAISQGEASVDVATGIATYIRLALSNVTRITGGGNNQQCVEIQISGIDYYVAGSGDTAHIYNLSDDLDGDYTENNTSDLIAGQYFVFDSTNILVLYDNQTAVAPARIKPIFPKYEHKVAIDQAGTEEQNINLMDYLTIYRPSYSTASDWKDDWWTIDMEDTTNNLLLNQSLLTTPLTDFWWLYTYSQYYQDIYSRNYTLNDNTATQPTILTSKKITHNPKQQTIDVIQEDNS